MKTEIIWLVLIEQELCHFIKKKKKNLGELVQDTKLCAAVQNHRKRRQYYSGIS